MTVHQFGAYADQFGMGPVCFLEMIKHEVRRVLEKTAGQLLIHPYALLLQPIFQVAHLIVENLPFIRRSMTFLLDDKAHNHV